jgi:hypothetical protein
MSCFPIHGIVASRPQPRNRADIDIGTPGKIARSSPPPGSLIVAARQTMMLYRASKTRTRSIAWRSG